MCCPRSSPRAPLPWRAVAAKARLCSDLVSRPSASFPHLFHSRLLLKDPYFYFAPDLDTVINTVFTDSPFLFVQLLPLFIYPPACTKHRLLNLILNVCILYLCFLNLLLNSGHHKLFSKFINEFYLI